MPSVPQSASPDLAAQHCKSQHSQYSGYKSPESESVSLGSFSGLNGHKDQDSDRERDSPLPAALRPETTTPTSSLQHNDQVPTRITSLFYIPIPIHLLHSSAGIVIGIVGIMGIYYVIII